MQSDITFYLKFLFASNAVKIIGEGREKKLANVTRAEYLQNLNGNGQIQTTCHTLLKLYFNNIFNIFFFHSNIDNFVIELIHYFLFDC